jgi:outer membrane murein-binding lipoprotein Lpp
MKSLRLFTVIFISGTFLLSGCATLKKMKKNADKINYTVSPEVL